MPIGSFFLIFPTPLFCTSGTQRAISTPPVMFPLYHKAARQSIRQQPAIACSLLLFPEYLLLENGSTNLSGDSTALSGVSSLFTNFSRKTPYFSGVSLKLLFSLVIFLYHQCFPKSFCYKWCLAPLFLFQTNPVKLHASMVIPTSLYVILLLVT